ncbi:MAG TPA: hydrogenase nickel incorporation protein HypB [Synergistales bacterium]|nr:hydrogenase nickel incorporation protein HypB [Synergistales bacterium]HRV70774.1 hydrogenase nickel incorporation protein HypB [Thermovirgaceae bacterium]
MPRKISILKSVMAADEKIAMRLRGELEKRGILMVNLIGSPGAGKTTLLEATLKKGGFRSAVIEGDVATSRDAERIALTGTPVIQINTHGGCHLEANLIEKALLEMDLEGVEVLFIENVGNLVCPAEFDLGEDFKIAVCSVPEGPDKPLKYPHLISMAKAVILTKVDLAEYLEFDMKLFWNDVISLNPNASRFEVASTSGAGIDEWISFLSACMEAKSK